MKIMVFDVAAEIGGALTVLNEFYEKFKNDKINEYVFVVSKPEIQSTQNIKVLRFLWIKKSWLHRLYFEHVVAPKLVKEYKADEVLSLQNIIVPHVKVPQCVFVHNALPFTEYRFSILKNRVVWVYQNILSRLIYNSIKKADKVIVQTKWMKEKCISKLKVNEKNIEILPPHVCIAVKEKFTWDKDNLSTFFYPASAAIFKNHEIIVEACELLFDYGIKDFRVVFTLSGNEDKNVLRLYRKVKEKRLPIDFAGSMKQEKVFEYYSRSVLVFPSYIETVGLPLIEAKAYETPIIASDCSYSHEVLDGYGNAYFFDPFNSKELADKMIWLMKSEKCT